MHTKKQKSIMGLIKNNKGQATLEFSLSFPIFLFVFIATLQFGYSFMEVHAFYEAANKAVRVAVTNPDLSHGQIKTEIRNTVEPMITPYGIKKADICIDYIDPSSASKEAPNCVDKTKEPLYTINHSDPTAQFLPVKVIIRAPAFKFLKSVFPGIVNLKGEAVAYKSHEGLPKSVPARS